MILFLFLSILVNTPEVGYLSVRGPWQGELLDLEINGVSLSQQAPMEEPDSFQIALGFKLEWFRKSGRLRIIPTSGVSPITLELRRGRFELIARYRGQVDRFKVNLHKGTYVDLIMQRALVPRIEKLASAKTIDVIFQDQGWGSEASSLALEGHDLWLDRSLPYGEPAFQLEWHSERDEVFLVMDGEKSILKPQLPPPSHLAPCVQVSIVSGKALCISYIPLAMGTRVNLDAKLRLTLRQGKHLQNCY